MAKQKSGMTHPAFYDLKDSFFFGSDALGQSQMCPRDGRDGCALVDFLPREHRGRCTHFLSWTWGYKVSLVQEAVLNWTLAFILSQKATFLYCCFFCNNQYRILVEGTGAGSENLEDVFEQRLTSIGRVVALLDTWDTPRYLTRIWTIYEQYTAAKLDIEVTMILPEDAH